LTRAYCGAGLISPADLSLYKITDSVEEAVAEVRNFYRVYHSMRYAGGHLVLRLRYALSPELLERIRRDFADILVGGTIEQTGPLPAEMTDLQVPEYPRLSFHFDRRSLGRLRQLIDLINQEGMPSSPPNP
jgi:hypothetical protein